MNLIPNLDLIREVEQHDTTAAANVRLSAGWTLESDKFVVGRPYNVAPDDLSGR